MKYYDLFVEAEIPKRLTKEELDNYFRKMQLGDCNAREEIIIHNIGLVINLVINNFLDTKYELKELVAIGLIGLIKSVDNFDINKGFKFSTYAVRCIKNEILMFIRKEKKFVDDLV